MNTKKIILIGLVTAVVLGTTAFLIARSIKGKGNKRDIKDIDETKNYIIGDSQTPFIDRNSTKARRISEQSGINSLWQGGKNLSWLKSAVEQYPVEKDVNSIIINIGTNGGFNPKDDVEGLINAIEEKFPNAKLFVVKGSWGWGGNVNVTEDKVNTYYKKFKDLGVDIIEPPIGKVNDPHGNLPIYSQIGQAIDRKI